LYPSVASDRKLRTSTNEPYGTRWRMLGALPALPAKFAINLSEAPRMYFSWSSKPNPCNLAISAAPCPADPTKIRVVFIQHIARVFLVSGQGIRHRASLGLASHMKTETSPAPKLCRSRPGQLVTVSFAAQPRVLQGTSWTQSGLEPSALWSSKTLVLMHLPAEDAFEQVVPKEPNTKCGLKALLNTDFSPLFLRYLTPREVCRGQLGKCPGKATERALHFPLRRTSL